MLFNLYFAKNTISSCFFLFFLIIDLYILLPAAIANIFNPIAIAELIIPIRKPSKEPKGEIEIHPVHAEAKVRKFNSI